MVGCVGLVRDVTRIPDRWQRGDGIYLLRGDGAALVRFVWEHAHTFSLAHDVTTGGLAARAPRGSRLVGPRAKPT